MDSTHEKIKILKHFSTLLLFKYFKAVFNLSRKSKNCQG